MHAYEKGIIWGNDNYLIQSAWLDVVLATHNVGRRGTGCVRMGGHQEGYTRPAYPGTRQDLHRPGAHPGRGPNDVRGGPATVPDQQQRPGSIARVLRRPRSSRTRCGRRAARARAEMVDIIYEAKTKGGLFVAVHQHVSDEARGGRACDAVRRSIQGR